LKKIDHRTGEIIWRLGGKHNEFTTQGWGATIEIDKDYNFIAHVTWNQASSDTNALLFVVETTSAGLKAEPDTVAVTLNAFCPMTLSDFTVRHGQALKLATVILIL